MEISRRTLLTSAVTGAAAFTLDALLGQPAFADELKDYRKQMFGSFFKDGLVEKLTPENYQKHQGDFEAALFEAENFFDVKTLAIYLKEKSSAQYKQDKKTVINALVQNLSLNGQSLLKSMKTSERIRQLLKKEAKLNFPRTISQIYQSQARLQKKIDSIDTLLPRATHQNKVQLRQERRAYQQTQKGLNDLVYSCRQSMFLLRWHYPSDTENVKVDFKKAKDYLFEAGEELGKIDRSLKQKNYTQAAQHLKEYRSKLKQGRELFQKDITILLKQAETNIGKNILGQPLTQIEYQGKLSYATKEFAREWEQVQKLIKEKEKN